MVDPVVVRSCMPRWFPICDHLLSSDDALLRLGGLLDGDLEIEGDLRFDSSASESFCFRRGEAERRRVKELDEDEEYRRRRRVRDRELPELELESEPEAESESEE